MKYIKKIKHMPLRWKVMAIFLTVLTVLLAAVSCVFLYYSTRSYTNLQEKYNEAAMKETSYQLDTIWNNVNMLYRTFNSQKIYTHAAVTGDSAFETVTRQMTFDQMVTRILHSNNLQNIITGILFYQDQDDFYYVGDGVLNPDVEICETQWYKHFVQSGGQMTLYGPLLEDLKSPMTVRNNSLYFIAPYHTGRTESDIQPFVLFSIRLDSLLEALEHSIIKDKPMMVVDADGELLYDANVEQEKLAPILSAFLENSANRVETFSYFDENYYMCAYYHQSFAWWIVFMDDARSFFNDLRVMLQNLVVIIAGIVIVSVAVVYLLMNKVMMPLTTLNLFIDIMQHDPDAYIEVDPGTETGRIGTRLNEMKHKIGTMTQEMYQLQLQERDAQISALQSQINPHFIYNTLDNIYCIAQMGETEPIICLSEHLSNMMRYSLSMKRSVVPLREELNHLNSYVSILNVRFGDKIRVINQIEQTLLEHPVLKLSLQPLAENAWYHSLMVCPEGGEIILGARVCGRRLEISVENTGAPMTMEECEKVNCRLKTVRYSDANIKATHGIGLENISNRLKLTFGESYKLCLSPRQEGGCCVTMTVPYQPDDR